MKKRSLVLLLIVIVKTSNAQTFHSGTINFDDDWKFTSIPFNESTSNKVDSVKLGGANWEDQFSGKTVNVDDSSLLKQGISLKNEKTLLKGHSWENVTLPHTAFPEPVPVIHQKRGFAYYKKTFKIPASYKGKRITIEFEGAMQLAEVWVNGKFVKRHLGGYLPFSVELTHIARYGEENTIFVKLDNRANPLFPPGKPVEHLDFLYYSGLYRDVWMHVTDLLHITNPNTAGKRAGGGVFVNYQNVSEKQATVNIKTNIKNESSHQRLFFLVQQLKDHDGNTMVEQKAVDLMLPAGSDTEIVQSMVVEHPHLWSPDHPYLYDLHTLVKDTGKTIDELKTNIGIRSIFINKEKGLLVNGKPVRITGSNRHMNYPWIGNALSNAANYRDAKLIKEAGINFIRLSHYPQDPSFYEACDQLGIMLIDCTPGWQFFNKASFFKQKAFDDIREMIRRDRNHPSVVLWETSLNEAYPPASFRCRQVETARSEWWGTGNFYTGGDAYVKACYDVPYDEWSGDAGHRDNKSYPNNPYLAREYGDYEFGGGQSSSRQSRGNGERALSQQAWNLQWEHNWNRQYYPRMIGGLTWAFFDGLAGDIKEVEAWGLCDLYRIPKFSYYFFKSQHAPQPMLYIANYWTLKGNQKRKVVVYSNCDSVVLYVNNKQVGAQSPDDGPNSSYGTPLNQGGHPFDGGNSKNLSHPPFTFFSVPFSSGTLKAVGYIEGKKVTVKKRETPQKKKKLRIKVATHGIDLRADGADAVFVYAEIVDRNGTIKVLDNDTRVHFTIQGDADFVGPTTTKAEAGIASTLLQAGNKSVALTIKATAPGIETAVYKMKSVDEGKEKNEKNP